MKKLFALLMTGVLIFGLIGCGNKPEEPAADVMPENMESMAAPIDALARCMLENKLEYDPHDPEFFWVSLFYFTSGYGQNHEEVTEEEGTYHLQISTPVMQEHAAALFAAYEYLFDLPSIMKGNVSYDDATGTYTVSRGDIGLSEMRLTDYAKTEDGYTVTAELWALDEEELIQAYDVTLLDSTYVSDKTDVPYYYSVKNIVPVSVNTETEAEVETETSDTTETAIFNGLADSHTAELTLTDGSVQPFQFDPDSDVAKIIASLTEGDGITISYKEQANGSLMLTSIE
ncbi:MAG: hypothetical protein IKU91_00270 [Anaerotignum sp.]|nr:hypothetical protein [Anaerotignum sp.]